MIFVWNGEALMVNISSRLSANDADAHLNCRLKGFGLMQIPRILALPHIKYGDYSLAPSYPFPTA